MTVGPGRTLSHYRLVEKIGEGGMGVVWKADDSILNRTVAIKVLPAEVSRDITRREMFLQEAQLAAQVGDAHIVQVYEFVRDGDLDFIVMEYVRGKPLSKMLHGRPLPPHKVADFGHQIARALSRAHRKQLLHRDLKPANILITPDGDAKVLDFGLATLFESDSLSQATTQITDELPREKRLAGTLSYMSPEQARMERLDGRSDIFSLGAILYEMSTGQLPFTGRTSADVLREVQQGRARPVHEVVPQVPLELDRIVGKAMAPRKRDRYQSMEDMAVDLSRLERELESGSSPSYEDFRRPASSGSRARSLFFGVAVVLGLAVVALGVWRFGFSSGSNVDERTILIVPMTARGQDQGEAYVGRAFAEAIAINLAQNESLKIPPIPESASLTREEASDLARELGAGRVLTGSVIRGGNEVTASLQLLDLYENRILWGAQETTSRGDLTSLAHSLARAVANELQASPPTLYLYPWNLRGSGEMAASPELSKTIGSALRSDFRASVEWSAKLLARFPDELDAHAISALINYLVFTMQPSSENEDATRRSLFTLDRLAPGNPFSEMIRAMLRSEHENLPQEAIDIYSQILTRRDISPAFRAWVLRNRALSWSVADEQTKALSDIEAALLLDPLHPASHRILSQILANDGRFEEAAHRSEQALALQPYHQVNQYMLGWLRYRLGDTEASLDILRDACMRHDLQRVCALYATVLHRAGQRSEALVVARRAEGLPDTAKGKIDLARFWVVAGERERALEYFDDALKLGLVYAGLSMDVLILGDSDFAPLRDDPRWEAIASELKRQVEVLRQRVDIPSVDSPSAG